MKGCISSNSDYAADNPTMSKVIWTRVYLTHSILVEVLLLKTISYFLIKYLKGSCWASWPASLSSSMFHIPEEPREILFNWLISTQSIIKNKTAPTGAALNWSGIHTHMRAHVHAHTHTHTHTHTHWSHNVRWTFRKISKPFSFISQKATEHQMNLGWQAVLKWQVVMSLLIIMYHPLLVISSGYLEDIFYLTFGVPSVSSPDKDCQAGNLKNSPHDLQMSKLIKKVNVKY